eukprot:TRINITY_DN12219_c0_g2_i8.p1 TRINITY_DN12219_c0_g2~~TRINITY_DN12219_c0_g2_i8.p1  ORF type:complete len:224 (-),score=38.97 TRINITY_DN12219_c0_g2_i8:88-759(-)
MKARVDCEGRKVKGRGLVKWQAETRAIINMRKQERRREANLDRRGGDSRRDHYQGPRSGRYHQYSLPSYSDDRSRGGFDRYRGHRRDHDDPHDRYRNRHHDPGRNRDRDRDRDGGHGKDRNERDGRDKNGPIVEKEGGRRRFQDEREIPPRSNASEDKTLDKSDPSEKKGSSRFNRSQSRSSSPVITRDKDTRLLSDRSINSDEEQKDKVEVVSVEPNESCKQ